MASLLVTGVLEKPGCFLRPAVSVHSFNCVDFFWIIESACKKLNCNTDRIKSQVFLEFF